MKLDQVVALADGIAARLEPAALIFHLTCQSSGRVAPPQFCRRSWTHEGSRTVYSVRGEGVDWRGAKQTNYLSSLGIEHAVSFGVGRRSA